MRITRARARRLAVRAGGLDHDRPDRVDVRHFRRVLRDVDVVQLDSVNAVDRAHHLVFHARLGPHDRTALDHWLWRSREAHECWAHVASVMAMEAWPLLAHRRAEHATHPWDGVQRVVDERPDYVDTILEQVTDRGPVSVSDLQDPGRRSESYWGWGPGKKVLHWLFLAGHTVVDHRDGSFRASWDLPGRVVPAGVLDAPPVPRDRAVEELALRAVGAQGVATAASAADHHRMKTRDTAAALEGLARAGRVVEVDVEGFTRSGWMLPDTPIPRVVRARALLAPFDPLVWFRRRTERLFGMRYRVEIYVPEPKREYGYYVLPFLLDDELVARVDCRADRASRRLVVKGAWSQPGVDRDRVARELATELRSLARHVAGGEELAVVANGDLAPLVALHA